MLEILFTITSILCQQFLHLFFCRHILNKTEFTITQRLFRRIIPTAHKSLVHCTPSVHTYLLFNIFSLVPQPPTQQHSTNLSPAAVLQFKFIIQTDCFPNSFQSCLLWLKINTLTIETDTVEESNAIDKEGAFNSYHKTRKTSPIHHPNERT